MKISIRKIKFLMLSVFAIVPLFRPRVLNLHNGASRVFYTMQCLLVCAVVLLLVFRIYKKGVKAAFSPISYIVILYKLFEAIAIYKNSLFSISVFVNEWQLIAATVFADYLLKEAAEEYLGFLSFYSGLLVLINNISFFMGSSNFTDATGNVIYFWSTRNHLASLFFIAFISAILIYGIKRTRITFFWSLFVILNVIFGTLLFNSSTTIVGLVVLLVLYIFFKKKSILYRPVLYFWGCIGLNIAIVIFRIQELFAWLIEGWLHKSLSFTGRTSIWDTALLYIYNSPIWGYGESAIFNFSFAKTEIVAHNQFLDIAIVCGIPGLILFGIILYITFKKLSTYKDSFVSRLIVCALLGYMVMTITESPNPYQPWFIMFAMAYRVPEIDKLYTCVTYSISGNLIIRRKIKKGNLSVFNQ